MQGRLQKRYVLIITVLCGVMISASYYIIRPLDLQGSYEETVSPGLQPVYFLSLLNVVPRIVVARIIWEALSLPGWLGEILGTLYWPCLGVFVSVFKHWVLWGVAVLAVNIGLLLLLLHAMSSMRIIF
jgi:hypothetical protein